MMIGGIENLFASHLQNHTCCCCCLLLVEVLFASCTQPHCDAAMAIPYAFHLFALLFNCVLFHFSVAIFFSQSSNDNFSTDDEMPINNCVDEGVPANETKKIIFHNNG